MPTPSTVQVLSPRQLALSTCCQSPPPVLTMARRPFLTSLTAMSDEFMPAGSKGKELIRPDCAAASQRGGKVSFCTNRPELSRNKAYCSAVCLQRHSTTASTHSQTQTPSTAAFLCCGLNRKW